MKTRLALIFAVFLVQNATASEMIPSVVPEAQWQLQVMTDLRDDANHEGFTIEVCSAGTGYVYHWWNRGWKRDQNEKTEITLSREDSARVYALAATFIRQFSLVAKWVGPPGKELLTVGITMNGGGVSCRREQIESAFRLSSEVSALIEIVNAALPKEKRIH